jgi:hypothetical protein
VRAVTGDPEPRTIVLRRPTLDAAFVVLSHCLQAGMTRLRAARTGVTMTRGRALGKPLATADEALEIQDILSAGKDD